MRNRSLDIANLDDLSYRLTCGVALADAVQELIGSGGDRAEEYASALFGAVLYLRGIDQELRAFVEAAAAQNVP